MSVEDAWTFAILAFIAGGFFGATLQLHFVARDLKKLTALIKELHND